MVVMSEENRNINAFLDMVAWAELGQDIINQSDNGYNVLAGSLPDMVITFSSYYRHPGILVDMDGRPGGLESTAAGRYQVLSWIWRAYDSSLGLGDFSPKSQDRIARQLIKECRATRDIEGGDIVTAIHKCRSRWASLPGAGYGQHECKIDDLVYVYQQAGGEHMFDTTGKCLFCKSRTMDKNGWFTCLDPDQELSLSKTVPSKSTGEYPDKFDPSFLDGECKKWKKR